MNLICRTCSETKSQFFNIFSHYENGKLSSEMLHECTSLEVRNSDLLPLHICSECLERLVSAWYFRTMAIESDSKLRKVFRKQPELIHKNLECKEYSTGIVKEEAKCEVQDPLKLENESIKDTNLNELTQENTIYLTEDHEANVSRSDSDGSDKEILPGMYIKQESDSQQFQYLEENVTIANNQNRGTLILNNNNANKSSLENKIKTCDSISNSDFTKSGIADNMLSIQTQLVRDTENSHEIATSPLLTNYVQLAVAPSTLPTQLHVFSDINEPEKSSDTTGTVKGNAQQEITATYQDSSESIHSDSDADNSKNILSEIDKTNGDEINDESKVVTPEEYKKLTYMERKKLSVYCKLCNKNFKYRYYAEVHIRKHNGDLLHKCEVCDKAFITTSQLKEHAAVHSETRPYACDICGMTFKMLPVLQNHRGTHSDDRPHKCNICNLSFRLVSYLKTHMKIHTNQKDYICEVCGKTFIDYTYLQSHLKFQHKVRNFLCTLCGKAYPTNSILKRHFRYTHTNEKPYACVHCDRRFKDKNVMVNHTRIHTGEKPHSCKMCGRKFRQAVALRTHMRTHTGEAPYACKLCSSQFKYPQDLKKHMKVHIE